MARIQCPSDVWIIFLNRKEGAWWRLSGGCSRWLDKRRSLAGHKPARRMSAFTTTRDPRASEMAAEGTFPLGKLGPGRERREPVGVERVARHVPVEVRRTISPPARAALAEALFRQFDQPASSLTTPAITASHGRLLRTPCLHQIPGEGRTGGDVKGGICGTPQASANDEVASVRRVRRRRPPLIAHSRNAAARTSFSRPCAAPTSLSASRLAIVGRRL